MLFAVNSMRSQVLYPGLPPQEAPVLIAEKRKLFFSFLFFSFKYYTGLPRHGSSMQSCSDVALQAITEDIACLAVVCLTAMPA